jgi:hypothetical protein
VAQDDSDEVLRLLILAVLPKAERPMDTDELGERAAAMVSVPMRERDSRALAATTTARQARRGAPRPHSGE